MPVSLLLRDCVRAAMKFVGLVAGFLITLWSIWAMNGPVLLGAVLLGLILLGWLGRVACERRQQVRRCLRRRVSCSALGLHSIVDSVTLDLSPGGFFVATDKPYPLMTRFQFELEMRRNAPPIHGDGVVRWINWREPKGMGIEIVELTNPDLLAQIKDGVTLTEIVRTTLECLIRPDPKRP